MDTRIIIILGLALALSSACQENKKPPAAFDGETQQIIEAAGLQPVFDEYEPDFSTEKRSFTFTGREGSYQDSIWVIMDGDKYVALYFAQEKPYFDVFASTPDDAPTELRMPVRHHNSTLLGTRLTTSTWYDKWALSGDRHSRSFTGGGDSLSLIEIQEWEAEGTYQRTATSTHRFTFKVDPYLGYIVDIHCALKTDDPSKKEIEFMNFMPRDVVNPWPGRSSYSHTIYTPPDTEGYVGYANNLYAGNLSDEQKTEWGKGFAIRPGGFIGMFAPDTPSPALFRFGEERFVQRTCDAWLDQHNNLLLPESADNGFYHLEPRFLFCYLPPAATNHILELATIRDFKGKKAVMIPLGKKENFEEQPLPLTDTQIGLTKGFWEEDFRIDSTQAYSGRKSLRIDALPDSLLNQPKANFIRYPQVPLQENTTYRLLAMAKVYSPDTEAWISASTYEWTPHDTARLARYQTQAVSNTNWEPITLEFTTSNYDPFLDLRFMARGKGYALFDDFELKQVQPIK